MAVVGQVSQQNVLRVEVCCVAALVLSPKCAFVWFHVKQTFESATLP